MQLLFLSGSFILGAILGSFLNALSFRWGTGVSILTGRSRCMHCSHTLGALDLIPIVSYLLLQGRCRYCAVPISIQYPLVELAAGLLSLVVFIFHPTPVGYAFWLIVWMVLLFIVVYDLRHTVIPWSCSLLLIVLALGALYYHHSLNIYTFFGGVVLALPLFLLWLISQGRWMGLGDSVLELSLGWLLGFTAGLTALMFAFWIGAGVGILLMALQRGVTMKSEVPLAPFLVLGALVVLVLHVDLFQTLPLLLTQGL